MKLSVSPFALVLVLAACASQETSTSPPASASLPATASVPASASVPAADELTGTWATGETSCAEQNAAVEAAGFTAEEMNVAGWDPTCAEGLPHGSQFTIRFENGALVAFQDGYAGWEGRYRIVDEDTFDAGDETNGLYLTYRYTIDGDELTIDMVEDDYPIEAEVIGDSLAQTVIYETAPFTRAP